MTDNEKIMAVVGILSLAFFMIFLAPLFYIWGWNQLFGSIHRIDYTFWNWLGAVALSMFFKMGSLSAKKSAQS